MTMLLTKLKSFKSRFPKAFGAATLALGLAATGGVAAYEMHAKGDSCCYPGSPCCYPGSPCCAGHDHAKTAQR